MWRKSKMTMTFEERKELADLEYDLRVAFYNYKDNKRLNNEQKFTLERVFAKLKAILKENGDQLMKQGKMGDYFERIYGIKQCGITK